MTRPSYTTFLLFVWISLIYVIIAFADVTAGTFARFTTFDMTIGGNPSSFAVNGGAVVVGATAYLLLSIALGLVLRYTKLHWAIGLVGSVLLMALIVWKSPDIAA